MQKRICDRCGHEKDVVNNKQPMGFAKVRLASGTMTLHTIDLCGTCQKDLYQMWERFIQRKK